MKERRAKLRELSGNCAASGTTRNKSDKNGLSFRTVHFCNLLAMHMVMGLGEVRQGVAQHINRSQTGP